MNQPLTFAAARRHRPEQSTNLLVPGRTCWRIERARKVSWLVDGEQYFGAVRTAMANAHSTIFIVGWDIDSRVKLVPTGANDGWPDALGDFLGALLASRPQLNAYILSWDYALLFALEREWLTELKLPSRTQQRLKFQLDDRHPVGASHHQKLIVVDDSIGFVSGFDLTFNRWDTPEHMPGDARRRNPDGTLYAPFHDLGVVVSGRAAGALGELARERWYSATGRHARHLDSTAKGDQWPLPGCDLADVDVAIARTEPRFEDHPGVFEVRDLHLDAIAAAKASIFAENQYFTSRTIAQALASTLEREAGPDIAILSPSTQSGWLETSTMGVLRARIHSDLVRADRHQRYRVYCPWLDGDAAEAACLNVHSKILIVDDEFLTIGSANLSGRSMGLDTECNLAIEAKGDEQVSNAIALLRNRLLAEHLARDERSVAEAVRSNGGLIAGIEALRAPGRSLKPLAAPIEDEWSALVPDHSLLDPEEPIDTGRLVEDVVSRSEKRSIAVRSVGIVAIIVLLVALALAWRYTPLRELINTEALARMADTFAESPFAPVIVVAAYLIGGLAVIPVTVMIAVTGIVFGPVLGFFYALIGETLSAIFIYFIGRKLGRATVRRVAGKRINELSRRIAKQGLIAVVVVRMLPIAPFTIINLIAGASHIRFRHFVLGTILGMAPGTLILVLFVDRIVAAVRTPGPMTFTLLALIAGLALSVALLLRSRLGARDKAIQEHGGPRQLKSEREVRETGGAAPLQPWLTVATYNIHDAIGADGEFCPERIAAVVAELNADVIALQEIGSHVAGTDVLAYIRDATGFIAVAGPTRLRTTGEYGNCLLTRYPAQETTRIDLTFKQREARGALDVLLDCDGDPLRIIATHLGLRPAERRAQIQQLLRVLETQTPVPTVLMGDLNEWFLWGRPLRWLHTHFERTPAPATFPASAPIFALDRIWIEPRGLLDRLWIHKSPLARVASDHLPLVARIGRKTDTSLRR